MAGETTWWKIRRILRSFDDRIDCGASFISTSTGDAVDSKVASVDSVEDLAGLEGLPEVRRLLLFEAVWCETAFFRCSIAGSSMAKGRSEWYLN